MNRTLNYILLIISTLTFFYACSGTTQKRPRKPVCNLRVIPNKTTFRCGDTITLVASVKLKDGSLKSVQLYLDNQLIESKNKYRFEVHNIVLNKPGINTFTLKAQKTDDLEGSRSRTLTVLSDIEPELLSYKVIQHYPHLKSSYTEGLEYYNGFLYEGTGEYGQSKLLKIDLESGHAVQELELSEKYFGEGITILNNKIYQLTYKAQKGFVYDLQSFALIDSFQFRSLQGWGLTNDGKNLIMSDGTHVLTWIDPNTYQEVKKLQVANSRGLMTNLNELEYVDEYIYANIYTSDVIVKIDSSTGKVLEEINLKGIIDMYRRPGEQIDVLNGIAYNRKNKHFYVTGKYYPRLFEVGFLKLPK